MKKILIADDHQSIVDLMNTWLHDEGFVILCARTLEEARSSSQKIKFDLVILDDLGGGGVALGEELHRAGQLVLITSLKHSHQKVQKLSKPFTKQQLINKVKKLLSGPAQN